MFGFGKPKINDPYNTMGDTPARPPGPGKFYPLGNDPAVLAKRHGITRKAAIEVSGLLEDLEEARNGRDRARSYDLEEQIARLIG
jgi:hypothetical protein